MKATILIQLSFLLIYGCTSNLPEKQADNPTTNTAEPMKSAKRTNEPAPKDGSVNNPKKATGIGGIFFKCRDPKAMREWYEKNLGLVTNEYGSLFEFRNTDNPDQKGYLQWSPFAEKTKYFEPSQKEFMINYRVENIEKLVEELKKEGVRVVDEIESFEYGKFVHIMDPEGNKIELWEPVDNSFTRMYEGKTTH